MVRNLIGDAYAREALPKLASAALLARLGRLPLRRNVAVRVSRNRKRRLPNFLSRHPNLSHCRMASPRGRLPNFLLLDLQSTIDCRAGTPPFQTKYLLAEEQEPLECKNCLGKAWRNVVSTYEAIRELDVLAVDVKQECKLLSLRDIAVRHRFDSRYSATPGRGRGATVGNPFAS